MLEHLQQHLSGKVVIAGIGNTFRSDDGIGSLLAQRLKDKIPYTVFDVASSPENYLGKIIKEQPDNIILIDAVDFGGSPGEFREIDAEEVKTTNLFATHNSSIALVINYLQSNITADIIVLIIQPKILSLGDNLSPEVAHTLEKLEHWFDDTAQKKR